VKSADVQGWIVGSHCQRRTATRRARRLLDGARVSRGCEFRSIVITDSV
jgi:hypothetical protein